MINNDVILITQIAGQKKFTVGNGENKTFVIFLKDVKDHNCRILIEINGTKANVQVLGLIIGEAAQKINLFTLQDHKKEKSVSDLLIKSVLFGSSRLNYEGLIKIRAGAQQSNAYQKNQNILMSHHAWADSRPKLEILANDVRCTHGATIGKIDGNVLYYLQSRGLSKAQSERLVIEGFFNEVLNRIPDKKMAETLKIDLNKKINENLMN